MGFPVGARCGGAPFSRELLFRRGVETVGLAGVVVAARLAALGGTGEGARLHIRPKPTKLRLFGLRVLGLAATSGPERILRFRILVG